MNRLAAILFCLLMSVQPAVGMILNAGRQPRKPCGPYYPWDCDNELQSSEPLLFYTGYRPSITDNILTAEIHLQLLLVNGPQPSAPLSLAYSHQLFPAASIEKPSRPPMMLVELSLPTSTKPNLVISNYFPPFRVRGCPGGIITISRQPFSLPTTGIETQSFDLPVPAESLQALQDTQRCWLKANLKTRPALWTSRRRSFVINGSRGEFDFPEPAMLGPTK